jgi:phage-related protein
VVITETCAKFITVCVIKIGPALIQDKEQLANILKYIGPMLWERSEVTRASAREVAEFIAKHAVAANKFTETRKLLGLQVDDKFNARFYKIMDSENEKNGGGARKNGTRDELLRSVSEAAAAKAAKIASAKPKVERSKADLSKLAGVNTSQPPATTCFDVAILALSFLLPSPLARRWVLP